MTDSELNIELFNRFVKTHSLKKGDVVKILRKPFYREFGWPLLFLSSMEPLIGQKVVVAMLDPYYGVKIVHNGIHYYVPVFVLEFIESARGSIIVVLTDNYSAEIDRNGNVQVGCQNISFEKLEEVYWKAKEQRD